MIFEQRRRPEFMTKWSSTGAGSRRGEAGESSPYGANLPQSEFGPPEYKVDFRSQLSLRRRLYQ